jgi:hypothetical protein
VEDNLKDFDALFLATVALRCPRLTCLQLPPDF